MNQESRVAVFVDAENLTQWIKLGGLEVLLEDLVITLVTGESAAH